MVNETRIRKAAPEGGSSFGCLRLQPDLLTFWDYDRLASGLPHSSTKRLAAVSVVSDAAFSPAIPKELDEWLYSRRRVTSTLIFPPTVSSS